MALERGGHLAGELKQRQHEYFLPVMGLVFLRHAYSRYLAVKDDIEAAQLAKTIKKNFEELGI
jgi:hypothetical protein